MVKVLLGNLLELGNLLFQKVFCLKYILFCNNRF